MIFLLSIIVSTIANLLLGVLVFVRNPSNIIHRVFIALAISIVGWIVTLFLYYTFTDPGLVLFVGRLNFAVAIFISYFFLAFGYFFPVKNKFLSSKVVGILGGVTILLSLITQFTNLVDADEIIKGVEREVVYGPLYMLYMIVFIGFAIIGIALQFAKLRVLHGVLRNQVFYVLWGYFLFFFFVLTTNFALPYYFNNYFFQPFGPVTTIFITGFATLAILRHKLLDIGPFTFRALTYVLFLGFVGAVAAFVFYLIAHYVFPPEDSLNYFAVSSIITVSLTVLFQRFQRPFERMTTRIFFKKSYDTDTVVLQLSRVMASTIERDTLIHEVLTSLLRILSSSGGMVIVKAKDDAYDVIKEAPFTDEKVPVDLLLKEIKNTDRMVFYDELPESPLKELLRNMSAGVLIPLMVKDEAIGYLILGQKISGDVYSPQDKTLLDIVTKEYAVALKNSQNFEEIKRFNITLQEEIKKATQELQEANVHLKELDKLKDDFLAIASHDLRTPMTALKGYLWLMLKRIDELPPEMAEKLRRVYNSSERMIALINDMLNVSRIEGGKFQMVFETFDLVALARDVEQELHGQANDRSITITINGEKSLVSADRNRTHEVLVNLLGNAIKFTPEKGSVTVQIEEHNGMITTAVTDTGIGIPKEEQSKLFQKFGRIDTSNTAVAQVPGTGLGLYICKKIVELSGGEITVDSTPKKGTTFTFTLKKGE